MLHFLNIPVVGKNCDAFFLYYRYMVKMQRIFLLCWWYLNPACEIFVFTGGIKKLRCIF